MLLEKAAFCVEQAKGELFEAFQEKMPFKGQELRLLICILMIQVFTEAHTADASSPALQRGSAPHTNVAFWIREDKEFS